jgi:hypothetical protein
VHDFGDISPIDINDEMGVIVHQAIGVHPEMIKVLIFFHELKINSFIFIALKQINLANTSDHYVED